MSVTYRQNDNYIDIYDGKMANCCQKVRGNKTKQTKTTTKANKQQQHTQNNNERRRSEPRVAGY